MSNLPLYKDCAQAIPADKRTANTGLWFTRFYSGFDSQWEIEKDDPKDRLKGKQGWIKQTIEIDSGTAGDSHQISDLLERQRKLCLALGGQVACLQTQGNFVTGTGLSHPVENGFAFHPTLGMPYLPASGVKGLLRGWVQVWMDHGTQDKQALIARWFGAAKGGDANDVSTVATDIEGAGSYIFFDALPGKPVHLGCDVMTPHMGKWYEKGGDYTAADQATAAPADWHSPVPVPFLVVKQGTDFTFMVAPRLTGNPEADQLTCAELPNVLAELKNALEWLGAGAKTAAGYGRMVDPDVLKIRDTEKAEQAVAQALRKKEEEAIREAEEREKRLADAGLGAEIFNLDASLQWDKGSRKLDYTVTVDGKKKTEPVTGIEAKKHMENLPDTVRNKLLKGNQVVVKVRVERQSKKLTLKEILF